MVCDGRAHFLAVTQRGIRITGQLFELVHEHLAAKRTKHVHRDREYVCGKCGREFTDAKEKRLAIEEDGKDAFVFCVNRKCREKILLWDRIEQKFASDEFREKVRKLEEAARLVIDSQDKELIMRGEVMSVAGQAGQIFRPVTDQDWGTDGEIEFRDYQRQASGQRVYVQLKSGDSHTYDRQRDEAEVFPIKNARWAEYWTQHKYPVMLVLRSSDGHTRWMNVSRYLIDKKAAGDWPVKQIVFEGEDSSAYNLLAMRRSMIGAPPVG